MHVRGSRVYAWAPHSTQRFAVSATAARQLCELAAFDWRIAKELGPRAFVYALRERIDWLLCDRPDLRPEGWGGVLAHLELRPDREPWLRAITDARLAFWTDFEILEALRKYMESYDVLRITRGETCMTLWLAGQAGTFESRGHTYRTGLVLLNSQTFGGVHQWRTLVDEEGRSFVVGRGSTRETAETFAWAAGASAAAEWADCHDALGRLRRVACMGKTIPALPAFRHIEPPDEHKGETALGIMRDAWASHDGPYQEALLSQLVKAELSSRNSRPDG